MPLRAQSKGGARTLMFSSSTQYSEERPGNRGPDPCPWAPGLKRESALLVFSHQLGTRIGYAKRRDPGSYLSYAPRINGQAPPCAGGSGLLTIRPQRSLAKVDTSGFPRLVNSSHMESTAHRDGRTSSASHRRGPTTCRWGRRGCSRPQRDIGLLPVLRMGHPACGAAKEVARTRTLCTLYLEQGCGWKFPKGAVSSRLGCQAMLGSAPSRHCTDSLAAVLSQPAIPSTVMSGLRLASPLRVSGNTVAGTRVALISRRGPRRR